MPRDALSSGADPVSCSQVLESEKGAKCYGLAKTMSDNIKYVGYEGSRAVLTLCRDIAARTRTELLDDRK